jgi:hypothetical protein
MSRRIWRHKNRVPPGAKIFTMTGSYNDVRESLLKRGWYENTDTVGAVHVDPQRLKAPLVSTLEPMQWKPGFKFCFFSNGSQLVLLRLGV